MTTAKHAEMEELYHRRWARHWNTAKENMGIVAAQQDVVNKDDAYECYLITQRHWVLGEPT